MSYGRVSQKAGRYIDNRVSEWLYGNWDEQKLAYFEAAYSLPFVHQYLDYKLDRRADQEYLNRYGMSYSDVHDPRKLRQTSSGASMIGSAYHMVSRNLDSLYEDVEKKGAKGKKGKK